MYFSVDATKEQVLDQMAYMAKTVLLLTVYYEVGLFLVMCHHAAYNHLYYYPEPDCCTGTISSWCVCMCVCTCVCVGGGGEGSLYSCID